MKNHHQETATIVKNHVWLSPKRSKRSPLSGNNKKRSSEYQSRNVLARHSKKKQSNHLSNHAEIQKSVSLLSSSRSYSSTITTKTSVQKRHEVDTRNFAKDDETEVVQISKTETKRAESFHLAKEDLDDDDDATKRVRFDLECTQIHEANHSDLTAMEKESAFYNKSEFESMLQRAKKEALTQEINSSSSSSSSSSKGLEYKLTGLESMTCFGKRRFRQNKILAMQAVLGTQSEARNKPEIEGEIAKIYRRACLGSAQQATMRGQIHANDCVLKEKPTRRRSLSLDPTLWKKPKGFWHRRQSTS